MTTATMEATGERPSKGLSIGLWIAQALLAIGFGMAGVMKTTTPIDVLSQKMAWVASAPWLVRFIGVSELAAAIGLILPAATRIQPKLTAWAGVGLSVIMVLGAGFHVMRGEIKSLPVNVILLALAAFVAWGRFGKAKIEPRS